MTNVTFLIESGDALELVRSYITDVKRVRDQNKRLAEELGVQRIWTMRDSGVMAGAIFDGAVPPDFKKPNTNGVSYPKKGTEWAKRLGEQKGHANQSSLIAKHFGIPLSIKYTRTDGTGQGWRHIGSMLAECGFLYLSEQGPYAMWIPDVAAEVASDIASGCTVDDGAASFDMTIPGCRRIHNEEWDLMVAKWKFDQKKATGAAA